jgi:hypothetical protein
MTFEIDHLTLQSAAAAPTARGTAAKPAPAAPVEAAVAST